MAFEIKNFKEKDDKAKATHPTSRKAAIDAMCKACVHDPKAEGTWKQQVMDCLGFHCPLYNVRPKSTIDSQFIKVKNID